MESESVIEELKKIISSLALEMQLELVDLLLAKSRFKPTLRVFADRKDGGITVAECTMLNRKIGDALEAKEFFATPYILEVSSPGLDRPLSTAQDFMRCKGRKVRFFLKELVNAKLEWMGSISQVEGDVVTVDISGTILAIPLSLINKACQEI